MRQKLKFLVFNYLVEEKLENIYSDHVNKKTEDMKICIVFCVN